MDRRTDALVAATPCRLSNRRWLVVDPDGEGRDDFARFEGGGSTLASVGIDTQNSRQRPLEPLSWPKRSRRCSSAGVRQERRLLTAPRDLV